ncbi:nucleoside monophosphate kinase [Candidatus Giovannonibacteria bacterium]|nr:nucleoside monophosphate kinase [Candidatus Giovannonibacteria bacterium]
MKDLEFPIFKTKIEGKNEKFSLEDPVERRKYFEFKAGPEIEKIRGWLETNTFVAILLGKKNSGKGTYSKLFSEIVGPERIAHVSVGDIVREAHKDFEDSAKKKELLDFMKRRYRGFISIDKAIDALTGRDTSSLLPSEFILALVEKEIDKIGRKAIFIDGFPRNLDQISYSLYFRSLIGYRDDPDLFVFIDLPESVIHERMRYRVVCPVCHTPRNLKLLRTKEVGYDSESKNFYLVCDNFSCKQARMVSKEGDELGIEAIRNRIEVDEEVMKTLRRLEGVPKILLRNSVPVDKAADFVDDYEITPAYRYELESSGKVRVIEEPWTANDDRGVLSYSLLPQAVTVSLIKQISLALGL